MFSLLGTTAFAAALPIGLLLFKTGHVVAAVHQLAVLFSAGGLTPLAVGLFLGNSSPACGKLQSESPRLASRWPGCWFLWRAWCWRGRSR